VHAADDLDADAAGGPVHVVHDRRDLAAYGDGPVVVSAPVPSLDEASQAARSALAGFRAAPAWPAAPRPVPAGDLLPERALAGDVDARRTLRNDVFSPLVRSGGELLETLDAFLAAGGVLESAARSLFVHPNTVRYRLRRIGDITGFAPLVAARRLYAASGTRHRAAGCGKRRRRARLTATITRAMQVTVNESIRGSLQKRSLGFVSGDRGPDAHDAAESYVCLPFSHLARVHKSPAS